MVTAASSVRAKNVVLDCRLVSSRIDGLGRYVVSLAEALAFAERTFDLTLILPNVEGAGPHPLDRAYTWPVATVHARPVRIGPENQVRSRSLLGRIRPDIYHFPHFDLPVGAPWRSVVTVHDVTPYVFPGFFTGRLWWLRRWYFWLSTARAVRAASAVVVPSAASANELERLFPIKRSRLHVVHEGVPEPFARRRSLKDVEDVRTRFGLQTRYFLYVGVDRPHKNLRALLTAYASVASIVEQDLVLVGHRTGRTEDLLALAKQLGVDGRVRWVGYITDDDLACVYGGADAFVLCSLFEGFGLPVVEAMACGTPVIASENTAAGEMGGDAALLVDPKSLRSIADALVALGTDPGRREQLSQRALERARRFTWASAAAATIDIYRSILPRV